MFESSRRRFVLQLSLMVVGVVVALVGACASASAAIYWGNGSTIGRMNLDGSYRLDGTSSAGKFIGYNGEQAIADACAVAVDGSHVYWADSGRGWIGRARLDGTEPIFGFITGASEPCGVAVDGSYVYWSNHGSSTIGRARLDGSDVRQDFVNVPLRPGSIYASSRPCGVAVNASHIFWASNQEDVIGRADVDGANVTPEFITKPGESPCGVAVNGTSLYWGSYSSNIGRAALDGSNPEPKLITGLGRPCGLALDGANLYWIEGQPGAVVLGRADLNGGSVTRPFASGLLGLGCGVAVNSLTVSPPAPPPSQASTPSPSPSSSSPPSAAPPLPTSVCRVEKTRYDRQGGSAVVAVRGPADARIEVLTKGLRLRMLRDKAPPAANGDPRRWLVEVRPASDSRAGKRILERLEQEGRATVELRLRCSGRGELPAMATKSLALTATRAKSRGA